MHTNLLAPVALLRRALTTHNTTVMKVAPLGTLLTLIAPYFKLVRTHGASALGVFLSLINVGVLHCLRSFSFLSLSSDVMIYAGTKAHLKCMGEGFLF